MTQFDGLDIDASAIPGDVHIIFAPQCYEEYMNGFISNRNLLDLNI